MRGPHNVFRLIQTGATFARTGALDESTLFVQKPFSVKMLIDKIEEALAFAPPEAAPDTPQPDP